VSILHRISGAIMFLLLPFIIWMFDTSVSSEISFAKFKPPSTSAWASRLVHQTGGAGLIWAYLHHFIAGMRHLYMDVSHMRQQGIRQALPPSQPWFSASA
jgi:succinate dehydrogenase / fumarate reductase cytochrome b subunit